MFNNFFYVENPAVYEITWKIKKKYVQTGHIRQYNTAHAHCMLDT